MCTHPTYSPTVFVTAIDVQNDALVNCPCVSFLHPSTGLCAPLYLGWLLGGCSSCWCVCLVCGIMTISLIAKSLALNLHTCCVRVCMCVHACFRACARVRCHLYVEAVVPDLFTGTNFYLLLGPCSFCVIVYLCVWVCVCVCGCDAGRVCCQRESIQGTYLKSPCCWYIQPFDLVCVCVSRRAEDSETEMQTTLGICKKKEKKATLCWWSVCLLLIFCFSRCPQRAARTQIHTTRRRKEIFSKGIYSPLFRQFLASRP